MIAMSMVGVASASLNNWTGFYAGAEAGDIFNDVHVSAQQLGFTSPNEKCNTSSTFASFSPGLQLGYIYQFPNSLISASIEANVLFNTNQRERLDCRCPDNPDVSDSFSFKNKMQSAIKGRVGRAYNWSNSVVLPYITTGASFANVGLTYKNEGGDDYSQTTTQTGWLIGAGIELAILQNWSLRAEYYYADYGNIIRLEIPSIYGLIDPNGNARVDLHFNNFVIAINYWI